MPTSFLTIGQLQELNHLRFDNVMNMFKGILELAMFLMSKHLLDDNISNFSKFHRFSVFDIPQIVSTLHKLWMQSTMRQRFSEGIFFIANTAVNVRLTYVGD